MHMHNTRKSCFCILTMFLLASLIGCTDPKAATKGNFKKALDTYFEKQHECVSVNNIFFVSDSKSDALVEAGLMTKQSQKGLWGSTSKYSVSPEGKKYQDEHGMFCYGHSEVTEIAQFSEPADLMGQRVSRVSFKYKVVDLAPWAKLEPVQKAFPEVKKAVLSETAAQESEAVLRLMNDGWSVAK